jgi:hypothetical protein
MRHKKRTKFDATQVAFYLSLNIEVIDDRRGRDLWAFPLLSLAWLVTIMQFLLGGQIRSTLRRLDPRLWLCKITLNLAWQGATWATG